MMIIEPVLLEEKYLVTWFVDFLHCFVLFCFSYSFCLPVFVQIKCVCECKFFLLVHNNDILRHTVPYMALAVNIENAEQPIELYAFGISKCSTQIKWCG